jgi:AAT family amino acid transporter/D-serine/D-alanine/glycine transporter
LFAIGGTIGVGLFLGAGSAIERAGPAVLICYLLAGGVVLIVLRALGEMALYRPVSGSFASYAHELIGPWAGFATGWTYWLMWVTTVMAELTAIGIYTHFFVAAIPQWVPGLVAIALFLGANVMSARVFGEIEFWFAIVKVLAIVLFIVSGLVLIVFGVGELGQQASFANLVDHGGFFPHGLHGPLLALQTVTYAFLGIEMVGVTAGEARDPQRVLPKAINGVVARILLFYVAAIAVMLALIPWNEVNASESPFVLAWRSLGIGAAAGILNAVVLTSALSSSNSGVFTTSRMLHALALRGHAPRSLAVVNRGGAPSRAAIASAVVLLIGVALNALTPDRVFAYVTSVATVGVLWTWTIILVAHLAYRRRVAAGTLPASPFRLPAAPWANVVALAYVALALVLLALDDLQRIALYGGAVWAVALAGGWIATRRRSAAGARRRGAGPARRRGRRPPAGSPRARRSGG